MTRLFLALMLVLSLPAAAAALDKDVADTVDAIRKAEAVDAICFFLGGSQLTGQMKPHSDIDLLAIFPGKAPYRALADTHAGRRFEIRTLDKNQAYGELQRMQQAGRGAIIDLLAHGKLVHGDTDTCTEFQKHAQTMWQQGPPPLTPDAAERGRYEVTALLDDFRDPRPQDEEYAIAASLYSTAMERFLASARAWNGSGSKWQIRNARNFDPKLAEAYAAAFQSFFQTGSKDKVIEVIRLMLNDMGGPVTGRYQR